jgi:predicted DsbA family dithiol-disulfide isomerase
MSDLLTVDVWSDVVCPFCYLGTRQLAQAIELFEHPVEVIPRAFELDPHAPASSDESLDELLSKKYQMPVEQAQAAHRRLTAQGQQLGIDFSFATVRRANSFDAHRLIALAATQGHANTMATRLFHSYFSDGLLISDRETLNTLADQVGVSDAPELWTSNAFVEEVRRDEVDAHNLGINGVPAFLIDQRVMVSGAQGVDALADALRQSWATREG